MGKWRQKFWVLSTINKSTHSDMRLIEFRQIKKRKKLSMAREYIITLMKVFRILFEFRILRLIFLRKLESQPQNPELVRL